MKISQESMFFQKSQYEIKCSRITDLRVLFLLYQDKKNPLQKSVKTETQIQGPCFLVHV